MTSPVDLLRVALADLESRERALAHAAEAYTESAAVQAAYELGVDQERLRILSLIELQRNTLTASGVSSLNLTALRRMVNEGHEARAYEPVMPTAELARSRPRP